MIMLSLWGASWESSASHWEFTVRLQQLLLMKKDIIQAVLILNFRCQPYGAGAFSGILQFKIINLKLTRVY